MQRKFCLSRRDVDELHDRLLGKCDFNGFCRSDDLWKYPMRVVGVFPIGGVDQDIGVERDHGSCISSRVNPRPPKSRPLSSRSMSSFFAALRSASDFGRRSAGTSPATGLPLRVIVTGVPFSASFSIFEKLRV